MSQFSNPASGAKGGADGYVRALLDLLGDRDPIAVMSEQDAQLRGRIRGLARPELARPERPGKWSIIQVLQHLADSELVFAYRMRMILAHDQPPIQSFDQDLWADRLGSAEANAGEALEAFGVLRRANLRLIRRLTPEQLERFGHHAERGRESVRRLVELMAGHDLVHRNQIDRILGRMKDEG